eukprot:c12972_g1_i2.p1 GENE.c12972_g1_i2~~c12972_g1_i2.p1  ORF type:complete len:388 (+),score=86.18 c12972_g1_i2:52-1215(+)
MSGKKVLAALFLIVASCAAETLHGRAEPIPSDKCATSVVTFEDERLYIFSLSEDSVVWHKFQKPEGGWSTWRPLADRKKMGSGPSAVRYENGTMQVFARGTDRKFYVTTMTSLNEWSDWSSPFGEITFTSPPVPVVSSGGNCYLFGVNAATHSVWYSISSPISSGLLTFTQFADIGGDATSTPSVLVDSESLVHVFIRGSNRALWHITEKPNPSTTDKIWGDWECLGGVLASAPRVPLALSGSNLVEVYARAADKALWHRAQNAKQDDTAIEWASWISLGGVLASGPALGPNDDGMTDVFARATDKAIYYKAQFVDEDGATHFTQWQSLGGMFSSAPTVVVRADGFFDVFARGVDKAIWHSHQIEVNGTRTYSAWHSLGGHTRKFVC